MMGNHVNIQIYNQMKEVLTMHFEGVQEGSANLLRRFGVQNALGFLNVSDNSIIKNAKQVT